MAYVGITRAEQTLYLTNANSRLLFGRTNYNQPSRFIREISSDLLDYQGLARPANTSFKASYVNGRATQFGQGMSLQQALQSRKASVQPSAKLGGSMPFASGNKSPGSGTNWSVGDIAVHKKWGRGQSLKYQVQAATKNSKSISQKWASKKSWQA